MTQLDKAFTPVHGNAVCLRSHRQHIQISHIECVPLDDVAAGFDLVARLGVFERSIYRSIDGLRNPWRSRAGHLISHSGTISLVERRSWPRVTRASAFSVAA